ncbi:hypothetical protein C1645_807400 [Glomus cerebriforme]|uniref:BTB domain-containing protein n=1 Tax=Glomus cerebriforme TaxID=658196 RepID=A0A397SWW7_9GLOM|nr:hypothetical protein C1645_807400 [Glomus cerebriforme]
MVNDKLLPVLSQNLLEVLDDEEYYDITVEVGNDPYIKIFRAHMVILYYRSPYLRRILSANKKKNDETLVHIKLPNILPENFQIRPSISEKLLIMLIQDKNLQMSETQIWEHVFKWGLAQNPEFPADLANFSKEDFNILKNSLQQFIPFIGFYNQLLKNFLTKYYLIKKSCQRNYIKIY